MKSIYTEEERKQRKRENDKRWRETLELLLG